MKKITVIFSLFLLFFSVLADADDKALKDEINERVTQLVSLIRDSYAQEYPKARGVQILRNGKDDRTVVVVVFTIESFGGGNNHTQFMAVFTNLSEESEGHPKRLSLLDFMAVGGKGVRSIEFKQIKIDELKSGVLITVPTFEYGPNDVMCCPSVKSRAQFTVDLYRGKRLEEVKQENRRRSDKNHKK